MKKSETRTPRDGRSKERLYRVWRHMKNRCHAEWDTRNYPGYGGRGIEVCAEWRADYLAFKRWALANDYHEDLQIDRIDNDGDYEPENCRWVTCQENQNNRRTTWQLEIEGETMSIAEAARRYGVEQTCIRRRLLSGWTVEEAVFTPPTPRRANAGKGRFAAVERKKGPSDG